MFRPLFLLPVILPVVLLAACGPKADPRDIGPGTAAAGPDAIPRHAGDTAALSDLRADP